MTVDYFAMEPAPGRYFKCGRYGIMSTAACGRNFKVAPVEAKTGRLVGCLGCEVGARHAGVVAEVLPSRWTRQRNVCVRCRRHSSAYGKRSNGAIRLVMQGTLCASCDMRERETIRGYNAKGTKPIVHHRPWPMCVGVLAAGQVYAVCVHRVCNLTFEVEGVIDRLWAGPPIDEITFNVPDDWWDLLLRKAERLDKRLRRMTVEQKPGADWPPTSGWAEPFLAPYWVRRKDTFACRS